MIAEKESPSMQLRPFFAPKVDHSLSLDEFKAKVAEVQKRKVEFCVRKDALSIEELLRLFEKVLSKDVLFEVKEHMEYKEGDTLYPEFWCVEGLICLATPSTQPALAAFKNAEAEVSKRRGQPVYDVFFD